MDAKRNCDALDGELAQCEDTIKTLHSDVKVLREGKYHEAPTLHKRWGAGKLSTSFLLTLHRSLPFPLWPTFHPLVFSGIMFFVFMLWPFWTIEKVKSKKAALLVTLDLDLTYCSFLFSGSFSPYQVLFLWSNPLALYKRWELKNLFTSVPFLYWFIRPFLFIAFYLFFLSHQIVMSVFQPSFTLQKMRTTNCSSSRLLSLNAPFLLSFSLPFYFLFSSSNLISGVLFRVSCDP